MTNHKKQLISLRVPANSFKTAAPNTFTKEAAPARPVSKIRSFLSVGIKWPRNKEKSEPGAPTDDHGHRHKGSFLSEKMHRMEAKFYKNSRPIHPTTPIRSSSKNLTLFILLSERFFRFMEVLFLFDSPRELAVILEIFDSKPVLNQQSLVMTPGNIFARWNFNEEKGNRNTISERITEKITSIAAKYRYIEKQPIVVENRFTGFKKANYLLY